MVVAVSCCQVDLAGRFALTSAANGDVFASAHFRLGCALNLHGLGVVDVLRLMGHHVNLVAGLGVVVSVVGQRSLAEVV